MNLITLDRKYTLGVSSLLLVSLTPLPAKALTVEEVPNPRRVDGGWVTDMTDILSAKTEVELNKMISQLEAQNGAEIAVVTVSETTPSPTPKGFTTELFNHWGIGKAEEDNGVLFLVSTGDRRVEIETGYGIEPILPDAEVGNIIDTKITPQFKQENYDEGTLAGTQALVDALQSKTEATERTSTTSLKEINGTESNQSDNSFGSLPFFGLIAILAVVTGLLFKRKHHYRNAESKSYTSNNFCNSNTNGSDSNGDRTTKDKSSANQLIASSSILDLFNWHSKNKSSTGTNSSSNKKSRRRSSSSRYSGSSYSGGSSSSSGSSYSGGSSSGGGGFGGGSSGGGGAGGSF